MGRKVHQSDMPRTAELRDRQKCALSGSIHHGRDCCVPGCRVSIVDIRSMGTLTAHSGGRYNLRVVWSTMTTGSSLPCPLDRQPPTLREPHMRQRGANDPMLLRTIALVVTLVCVNATVVFAQDAPVDLGPETSPDGRRPPGDPATCR